MSSRAKYLNRQNLILISIASLLFGFSYWFYGVKVSIEVDPFKASGCPISYPIKITVANHTFKRLIRGVLVLEAWRGDVSINILHNYRYPYDKITARMGSTFECFRDDAFKLTTDRQSSTNEKKPMNIGSVSQRVNEIRSLTSNVEIVIKNAKFEFDD